MHWTMWKWGIVVRKMFAIFFLFISPDNQIISVSEF